MRILSDTEPKKVFSFFEDICSIPHGSGNTRAISNYIADFAKSKNYEYYQDSSDNVIIIKPATSGYENSEPIILQAHIDMVCEKESDCPKDMSTESVDIQLNGDLISAKGTTLGADNGIGAAYCLAVLDDDTLSHPRIEAVFTSDEEIGMLGAFDIDVSHLKGKMLLNLDCGCEKVFTVSCAGGITSKSSFSVNRADFDGTALKITLSGLAGGHSGVKIGDGGANSHSLMGRLLSLIARDTDIRLSHIEGGFKDNAIPVETTAVIVASDAAKCKKIISDACQVFKKEYIVTDPDLVINADNCDYSCPFDKASTDKILAFLNLVPNGVQTMSSQIKDLVQTSLNFAIINTSQTQLDAVISVRSSVETQKYMLADKLCQFTTYLGGQTETWGDYPGWEYNPNSVLRDTLSRIYKEQSGTEPVCEAVHAGLECGLFSGKIPGLDCVSYGPDMWDVHTPRERLSVSSVQNVWKLLCKFLKEMK